MTQVLDIVAGALRSIGALESGEQPDPDGGADALGMLNDMIAGWSNSRMMLSYQTDVVFTVTPGLSEYTIGPGGSIGATIVGSVSGYVLTITSVTAGRVALGQTLVGTGIPANATIVAFGTGAGGGSTSAPGTYTLSQPANVSSISIQAYYQRPLRINTALVRVNSIDYPVAVLALEQYETIGLKQLNGPWASALYYQPTLPLGHVTIWPVPGSGEMHLYCDTVLTQFYTLSDQVVLPQGYNLALRYGLAELLIPEYGRGSHDSTELIIKYAAEGRALIKRTNMQPQQSARFDPILNQNRGRADAAWIYSGGFIR